MTRHFVFLAAGLVLGPACGAPAGPPVADPTRVEPSPAPRYEVHEWGLVRGTADNRVMLSGPRAPEPVLAVTKPVLYFHRTGDGAVVVDAEARIPNGRIVEHWPSTGDSPGSVVRWHHVVVGTETCHGSRYPSLGERPCSELRDGCESATLAVVETTDSSCLFWPRPPGNDGPTEAWNHLFYRGEVPGDSALPLRAEPNADGTLRLTATGTSPIPGHVLRIHHAHGNLGSSDALVIAEPPAPGASVVVGVPSAPLSSGPAALDAMLREVGLTSHEADAFGRAWNEALFGPAGGASLATETGGAVATTSPTMPVRPRAQTSILYVLPSSAADALATLRFTPPPEAVRRAIVVWIDETAAR